MMTPIAYYNEWEPFACWWMQALMAEGAIARGYLDNRSIEDVTPRELTPFAQCHFFAGIGVWSYALRAAGWPDSRPVWTVSCPCQPFSASGKKSGFDDERHLWPAFYHILREHCAEHEPPVIIGEQVASKAAEPWFDLVQADLEALGYAFGCIPFPSAGVGAPHVRDRAYWVAYSSSQGLAERDGTPGGVEYAEHEISPRRELGQLYPSGGEWKATRPNAPGEVVGRDGEPGPTNSFWRDVDWLACRDGKWRPVEPGTFPLADGAPARVGRLRGYGNAINAEAAKIWIETVMDVMGAAAP